MINGKDALVEEFVLHRLGAGDVPSVFNDFSAVLQGPEEQTFLRRLFLKPFSQAAETFTFAEGEDGDVFHGLCAGIRAGRDLVDASRSIAQRLLEVMHQQEMPPGDCFVVRFTSVEYHGGYYDAVGVLKFEEREVFIESRPEDGRLNMRLGRGLGTVKPALAVLVVFTPATPTILTVDTPKHAGAWRHGFIGLCRKEDHVNTTRDVMTMARTFITEQLPEVDRPAQIDLLNRSVQYFKDNAEFDRDHFVQEVFAEPAMIDAFDRFGRQYSEEHDVQLKDRFDISAPAVKSQARVFKSVLKLDKDFHIYIHGDRNKIERGVDPDTGRKYYKIWYDQEH